MKLNQLTKFENQNDISVSIYGFDEKPSYELYPIKISKAKSEKHVM